MDAQRISEPNTRHKRKFAAGFLDYLHDDLKSCKYLKVVEEKEPQPIKNPVQVSTLEGNCQRVSVQQDALNFQRSGVPSTLLYYDKGHWREFSQDLLPCILGSFLARKSSIRLSIGDKLYALNFICMIQVNLRTGFARSIAWIDRSGKHFSPSKCIEQSCTGLLSKLFDGTERLAVEALQDGMNSNNIDSGLCEPQVEITRCDPATNCCDFTSLGDKLIKLAEDEQDFVFAKEKFLSGFSLFSKDATITGIHRNAHTSLSGQARLQAFNIQEGITATARGDANVRYAWHGTSREGVLGIVRHGFGQLKVPKNGDAFGVGVYLAPEDASHVSAMYSDVDENGEQHILLCKVIMGRMEQVFAGSQQFHPSSEDFDTGVDDATRPKRYIVWSTHMNTHILPLFIISFKLSTIAKEVIVAAQRSKQALRESLIARHFKKDYQSMIDAGASQYIGPSPFGKSFISTEHSLPETEATSCMSGVSTGTAVRIDVPCPSRLHKKAFSTPDIKENTCSSGSNHGNVPHSPWISFPELFPLLESKLEPQAMNVLQKLYAKFQVGKLPRSLFVKMIRHMLGDDFLRECIKSRPVQAVSNCSTHSRCG